MEKQPRRNTPSMKKEIFWGSSHHKLPELAHQKALRKNLSESNIRTSMGKCSAHLLGVHHAHTYSRKPPNPGHRKKCTLFENMHTTGL